MAVAQRSELGNTDLDETSLAVEVQVQVFDLAVIGEAVHHVVLVRLLVHIGDDDDPALDGCSGERDRAATGAAAFRLFREARTV